MFLIFIRSYQQQAPVGSEAYQQQPQQQVPVAAVNNTPASSLPASPCPATNANVDPIPQQPGSDDLTLEMGRSLSEQLAAIQERAKLILAVKNELDTIHTQYNESLGALKNQRVSSRTFVFVNITKEILIRQKGELETQLGALSQEIAQTGEKIRLLELQRADRLRTLQQKSKQGGIPAIM